jgi:hypothetical protein
MTYDFEGQLDSFIIKALKNNGEDYFIVQDDFIGDETDPRCFVANLRGLAEISVGINSEWEGSRDYMTIKVAVEPWRCPYFPFVFMLTITLIGVFCGAPVRYFCFDKIFIPCCCPYTSED